MTNDTASSSDCSHRGAKRALSLLRRAHNHELRGELNALRLQVTLLQRAGAADHADPEAVRRWIAGVAEQAAALERRLDALSALERLDEEPAAAVSDVVRRVAQLLQPLAKARRAEIAVEAEAGADGTGTTVAATGDMAHQVLKLGARCLADSEPGTCWTLAALADRVELRRTGSGDGPALEALRQGVHSPRWSVDRHGEVIVLRHAAPPKPINPEDTP